jgi:hypothetical protein
MKITKKMINELYEKSPLNEVAPLGVAAALARYGPPVYRAIKSGAGLVGAGLGADYGTEALTGTGLIDRGRKYLGYKTNVYGEPYPETQVGSDFDTLFPSSDKKTDLSKNSKNKYDIKSMTTMPADSIRVDTTKFKSGLKNIKDNPDYKDYLKSTAKKNLQQKVDSTGLSTFEGFDLSEGPAYEYKKHTNKIAKSMKQNQGAVLDLYELLRKKGLDKEATMLLDAFKKNLITFKKTYDKIMRKLV